MTNLSIIDPVEISNVNILLNFNKAGSTSSLKASYSNFITNDGIKTPFDSNEVISLVKQINNLKGKRHRQKKIPVILYAIEIVHYKTKSECYILTNSKLINITNSVEYPMSNTEHEKMKSLFFSVR